MYGIINGYIINTKQNALMSFTNYLKITINCLFMFRSDGQWKETPKSQRRLRVKMMDTHYERQKAAREGAGTSKDSNADAVIFHTDVDRFPEARSSTSNLSTSGYKGRLMHM